MKKNINKLEHSVVELTFSFDGDEWTKAIKKSFSNIAKNVNVPGFRKGKAPEELVKSKVGQAEVLQGAIDIVLQPAFENTLKDENLRPFTRPEVMVQKLSDTEMEAKITVITEPTCELGQYKGLTATKQEVTVSSEEVDNEIKKMATQNAELQVKESDAQLGDTVVIDFEGFIDGKAFDGGKGENYSLELGSHSFIPGFEESLVGTKAGESKDINVTFPEQYVENGAVKPATFKVTVHEVKEKVVPEINDDFVADLSLNGVENLEQLKEKVTNDVKARKEHAANQAYFDEILAKIVEGCKFDINDKIIDIEVAEMKENLKKQIEGNGMTLDQYFQITGQKEEDVTAKMREQALTNVQHSIALSNIAQVENIQVTKEDIDNEFKKLADQYKMDVKAVEEALKPQMNELINSVGNRKLSDFLMENNK